MNDLGFGTILLHIIRKGELKMKNQSQNQNQTKTHKKFSDQYKVLQTVGDYQIWEAKDEDLLCYQVARLDRSTGEMIIQTEGFLNEGDALDWIYDYGVDSQEVI